ncbi:MAG: hypothetical protein ACERKN_14585 [Velocimicrobium sp.]
MQGNEKTIEIARVAEAVDQLDEAQGMLEGVAYDILNCSDSIRNATQKVMEAVESTKEKDVSEPSQTIANVLDCLEELSTFIEDMSMCAHYNEEISAKQHEVVEEIKEMLDDYKRLSKSW